MLPPHFFLKQTKVDKSVLTIRFHIYLTEEQARHVYKKVETDKMINIETMKLYFWGGAVPCNVTAYRYIYIYHAIHSTADTHRNSFLMLYNILFVINQ